MLALTLTRTVVVVLITLTLVTVAKDNRASALLKPALRPPSAGSVPPVGLPITPEAKVKTVTEAKGVLMDFYKPCRCLYT